MFYERLKELCKNRNTSVTAMAKNLGLSSGNVTNWKNGRKPKTDIALKIANFLNVSVEYLLGEYSTKDNPAANSDEALMFALWGGDSDIVDDEMIEDVKDFAKLLAEKKKRKLERK